MHSSDGPGLTSGRRTDALSSSNGREHRLSAKTPVRLVRGQPSAVPRPASWRREILCATSCFSRKREAFISGSTTSGREPFLITEIRISGSENPKGIFTPLAKSRL